jgi:CxxC motif-containing protein (DUF1111 family)
MKPTRAWRLAAALGLAGWVLAAAARPAITTPLTDRRAYSQPIAGLSDAERERFYRGRSLFNQSWVAAPSRDAAVAGLGPLYNRLACVSCHPAGGRGQAPDAPQERMRSMLVRLSVPGKAADGGPRPHPVYGGQLNESGIPGVPGEGWVQVSYEDVIVPLVDGDPVHLRRPRLALRDVAYGDPGPGLLMSARVGSPVYGLGLLEAVSAATLRAHADSDDRDHDGIAGRPNRVWDVTAKRTVLGRFGWKANAPNLAQQIAAAFVGDIGITSPIYPDENCTPAELACRQAPSNGHPEISAERLADVVFYVRALAAPARRDRGDAQVQRGERLFRQAGCAGCHRPTLQTGQVAALPQLAGRTIHPYTDLLLHDLGEDLADHRPDYAATGRQWRTPPLWGIGLQETVNGHTTFLHDGRARNLLEAILWHGGEATAAREQVRTWSRQQREDLLRFLRSL